MASKTFSFKAYNANEVAAIEQMIQLSGLTCNALLRELVTTYMRELAAKRTASNK